VTERTLLNFAVHGKLQGAQAADAGKAEAALARFGRSGVEVDALAQRLQDEGLQAHTTSWQQLLERVALVGGLPAALPGVSPSQSGRTDTGAPATETAKA
jgi:transaldolase